MPPAVELRLDPVRLSNKTWASALTPPIYSLLRGPSRGASLATRGTAMARTKKQVLDAHVAHWDESAPDYQFVAEIHGADLDPGLKRLADRDEAALRTAGLGFTREQWDLASDDVRKLANNGLKVMQDVTVALEDVLAAQDPKVRARAAAFLEAMVTFTKGAQRNLTGYDYSSFRSFRVARAAEQAQALEPLLADAKRWLAARNRRETDGALVPGLGESVGKYLKNAWVVRTAQPPKVDLSALGRLGKATPRAIAVKLAAGAWGVQESETRSGRPRGRRGVRRASRK